MTNVIMILRANTIVIFTFCLINFSRCEWDARDYMRKEHSIMKPYQGGGLTIPYWDFFGSTLITSDFIRLTPDEQSKTGALWNSVPCHIRNWEIQIHFKIHGHGKELFGDGLAVWYTKDRMRPGSVFGSIDPFMGLAVILDTYNNHNGEHNHKHPYISAMVNNGTLHYDHDSDGTHSQIAGCSAKFRDVPHDTYIAIRYTEDTLSVYTDVSGTNAWTDCFSVSGIQLPTGYFFGITAATGDLSDNHDIIAMRFYQLDNEIVPHNDERSRIVPSAASPEPPRDRIEDAKPLVGGPWKFVFILLGAAGLSAGGFYAIVAYLKHKERSRKRFY